MYYRIQKKFLPLVLRFALALLPISWPATADDTLAEAKALSQQASDLVRQGRYGEAEPIYKRALALREQALGPDHPDVADSLNSLGLFYQTTHREPEAEPLFKRSLAIREKALAPDSPYIAMSLNNLALVYQAQARYGEADPLFKQAVQILEKARGPDHPDVAIGLTNLAGLYAEQGRYTEAEPLYQRAVAIFEKVLGPDNLYVAKTIGRQARLYEDEGRYADAEPLYVRAVAISQKVLGPDHPDVASAESDLTHLYDVQGRYAEAEPLYKSALPIQEKAFGASNHIVAVTLTNLGLLYLHQGRYPEAEPTYQAALQIDEKTLGPDHPDVASDLNNLANLYQDEGRYAEAEPLYQRSVAIGEKALGSDNPDGAVRLSNLGSLYRDQGRYAEAESLFKRALAIREKALGPDHADIAGNLTNLGLLYREQGRYAEAEALYKRALAILQKAFGPDHPDVAVTLNNLAVLYKVQGLDDQAEPLYKRALAIDEKLLGSDHPEIAVDRDNLAGLYQEQGHGDQAEPLYRSALEIREKALGAEHPDVATSLSDLASLYVDERRYAEAEPLYQRAVAIREKALGSEHPDLAGSLDRLAYLYGAEGRYDEALADSSRAVAIDAKHLSRRSAERFATADAERRADRRIFANYIAFAKGVAESDPGRRAALAAKTFRIAQQGQASSVARAVAGMTARFAAGGDALADAIGERQDLVGQWQTLDAAIVKVVTLPPAKRKPGEETALRAALDDAERRLDALDQRITAQFPDYAALSNPQPVAAEDAQALLGEGEALLLYLTTERGTWLWVVRHTGTALYPLSIEPNELADKVTALRAALDPERNSALRPFPGADAYALYQAILAPAAAQLGGVHRLLVVPDGALESLPLSVLVTAPPEHAPADAADYRKLAWLVRDYAISVLPSVSSLAALRHPEKIASAASPFLGVGDPVLTAGQGETRGKTPAQLFRGTLADVDEVRKLPDLPETADELRTIAKTLGAREGDLLLGEEANEPALRLKALADYRVIEFATHGLLSGDLPGLAEPALVLTPPATATADNDGLLTASKIATLKLNADWVVLSACNTAGDDGTPDAEGLSGLAKAFFYAGARSVLVSHWQVPSKATLALTTRAFAELAKDPAIGRAEALRRAELAMLDPKNLPDFANPMFWAPFVIAGEGAPGR
jgi:tetratricopeptide (TPR) repeat protein